MENRLRGRDIRIHLWLIVPLLAITGLSACGGSSSTSTSPPPPISNPVPSITSLSPSAATAGGAALYSDCEWNQFHLYFGGAVERRQHDNVLYQRNATHRLHYCR